MDTEQGKFIVLEGIDRSGKTTQSKLLVNKYKELGMKVKYMRFPNRESEIGKMINDYLTKNLEISNNVIHLLFSANRWESVKEIKELLKQGYIIICDRYSYSGMAYSIANECDINWVKQTDIGLPEPNCVIYITIDPLIAEKRGDYGLEKNENIDFQKKVHEAYKLLVGLNWKIFNGEKSAEILHNDIIKYLKL